MDVFASLSMVLLRVALFVLLDLDQVYTTWDSWSYQNWLS